MDDRANTETWLTAADCARRIGLSVRALRLYEQHGLIAPRRTRKTWRLYGPDEIARLNEVLALKSLGSSLARADQGASDRGGSTGSTRPPGRSTRRCGSG